MVLDYQVVIAGSFNYTAPANMVNDENIIILGDLETKNAVQKRAQQKVAGAALAEIDRIITMHGQALLATVKLVASLQDGVNLRERHLPRRPTIRFTFGRCPAAVYEVANPHEIRGIGRRRAVRVAIRAVLPPPHITRCQRPIGAL